MSIEIKMPVLSAGMETGTLAKWFKKVGDSIAKGDILAEIETDKVNVELESEHEGKLTHVLVAEGSLDVPVETTIALLNGNVGDKAVITPPPAAGTAVDLPLPPAFTAPPAHGKVASKSRITSSPLARRLAHAYAIDLHGITATGPHGRIVRRDVEHARAAVAVRVGPATGRAVEPAPLAPPAYPGSTGIAHTPMRRTIARRLLHSKTTIPHFYLTLECRIDALLDLRKNLNAVGGERSKITTNDFIVKALAKALSQVPEANIIWTDDAALQFSHVDLAVAVATDTGLMTPVVRNACSKSLGTISQEIRSLAQRARDGRLTPAEYQGGVASVSNLGMFAIQSFTAIINPPHSVILAVGAAEKKPVCLGDDIVSATVVHCTLSVDHRAVDGAVAARLFSLFKAMIEDPLMILL